MSLFSGLERLQRVVKGLGYARRLQRNTQRHLGTSGVGLTLPHIRNSNFHEFNGKLEFQCNRNGPQKVVSLVILCCGLHPPNLVLSLDVPFLPLIFF